MRVRVGMRATERGVRAGCDADGMGEGRGVGKAAVPGGGEGSHRVDTTFHRWQPAEEARRVEDLSSGVLVSSRHALLHRVRLMPLDPGAPRPPFSEAAVPVDEHAVHVDEDDWRCHRERGAAVRGDHGGIGEGVEGVLLSGGAHLQPAALPLSIGTSELAERVHERRLVVRRQNVAVHAVSEHLWDAGDIGGDDREATDHRLRDHHWSHLERAKVREGGISASASASARLVAKVRGSRTEGPPR